MKSVNMPHAFGRSTAVITLYKYEIRVGKQTEVMTDTQWTPHIISWQTEEGDVGSSASFDCQVQGSVAYLLMHMDGGKEIATTQKRVQGGVG